MRPLSASQLLQVWEQGTRQPAIQQALLLLAAACPDMPPDTLAELSIGQRDARLLTLREWTFGSQVVSLAMCPTCGERLELTFNLADIRVEGEVETAELLSWSENGYVVRFRPPNSLDLAAVANDEVIAKGHRLLLERCLVAAEIDGRETAVSQLPAEIVHAVTERMAQADPQADVQLALTCTACGHQWQAVFDIVSFFWAEINAWAYRTLNEVHLLASTYSWREADILALSPWRRQFYLEMVNGRLA